MPSGKGQRSSRRKRRRKTGRHHDRTLVDKHAGLIISFRDYLTALNRSAATIGNYTRNIQKFLTFLERNNIESPVDAGWDDIEKYQGWLLQQQYQPSSVETLLRAVRAFYRYLQRRNLVIGNPAELVDRPKQSIKLPRNVLSEAEVTKLLEMPDTKTDRGILHRAILETFYHSGLRLSELCHLQIDDVDTAKGEVTVRQGKGGKDRIAVIGNSACLWIRAYKQLVRENIAEDKSERTLFLGSQRGRPIHPIIVQRFVREYARDVGITKHTTPHVLRVSVATHLLKNGASLMEIRDFLGHALVSTTQRYAQVHPEDVIEAHKKFHPREQC